MGDQFCPLPGFAWPCNDSTVFSLPHSFREAPIVLVVLIVLESDFAIQQPGPEHRLICADVTPYLPSSSSGGISSLARYLVCCPTYRSPSHPPCHSPSLLSPLANRSSPQIKLICGSIVVCLVPSPGPPKFLSAVVVINYFPRGCIGIARGLARHGGFRPLTTPSNARRLHGIWCLGRS